MATDNGWSAEEFLQQVCRKAGLPVTAWEDQMTILQTFEGHAIEGEFETNEFAETQFRTAGPVSADDLQQLADLCTRNVRALATGGTPNYYLPTVPDTPVLGMVLTVMDENGRLVGHLARHSLRPGLPLQTTLYQLCEQVAQAGGVQSRNATIGLTVMSDVAMHGSLTSPDLRGVSSGRALLVIEGQRTFWKHDPTLAAEDLLASMIRDGDTKNPMAATVFSLATTSNVPAVEIREVPESIIGPTTRPPAVAGSFYPADRAEMDSLLDELLVDPPQTKQRWPAAMIPHAGWRYSGRLAAQVLQRLDIPDTVIVIGPKHTDLGVEFAVAPHEVWQLPGKNLNSDPELAEQLALAIPGLELDSAAHAREHAIEVELPLLARLAPDSKVVGLALGRGNLAAYQAMGAALAEFMDTLPEPPLLLISSDMNHFATDAENRRLDELALQALETLDPARLYDAVDRSAISMCGVGAAVIVLEALRRLGKLKRTERVGYLTSGEISGDLSRVVGYAGMLIG